MAILFAAVKNTDNMAIFPVVALGIALAVALILAMRVFRDLKGENEQPLTETNDLLQPLIDAFASGQMSQEEYRRARQAINRVGGAETEAGESFPTDPKVEPPTTLNDPVSQGLPASQRPLEDGDREAAR